MDPKALSLLYAQVNPVPGPQVLALALTTGYALGM